MPVNAGVLVNLIKQHEIFLKIIFTSHRISMFDEISDLDFKMMYCYILQHVVEPHHIVLYIYMCYDILYFSRTIKYLNKDRKRFKIFVSYNSKVWVISFIPPTCFLFYAVFQNSYTINKSFNSTFFNQVIW